MELARLVEDVVPDEERKPQADDRERGRQGEHPVGEEPHLQQWPGLAEFDAEEGGERDDTDQQRAPNRRGRPANGLGLPQSDEDAGDTPCLCLPY